MERAADRDLGEAWKAFARSPGEETFAPVYDGTRALVWTICVRILRDREAAGDAFQSAYTRLVELGRDPEGAPAVADIGTAATRFAVREAERLQKRRRRHRTREVSVEDADLMDRRTKPVEDAAAGREVAERLADLLGSLPSRERLPVELHYFSAMSLREIARALDLPLGTVVYRIEKALRRLEPACRRAGLGPASASLAAIAATAALLDPPLSAAAVFARSRLATATSAAGSSGASAALAGLLGISIVKTKMLVVGSLVALLLLGSLGGLLLTSPQEPTPPETVLSVPAGAPGRPPRTARSTPKPSEPVVEPTAVSTKDPSAPVPPSEPEVIAGIVVDAQTEEPIEGAVVRAGEHEETAATTTDESGAYELEGLDAGTHAIVASAEGYADRKARVHHVATGPSLQDFTLDPAVTVFVRVVDADGAPLEGALVVPSMYGSRGAYYLDEGVETDVTGTAIVPRVSTLDPARIQVGLTGYQTEYVDPPTHGSAGSPVDLRVTLERSLERERAIVGRVRDTRRRPIEGAVVEWKDGSGTAYGEGQSYGQHRAVTDRRGFYRLVYTDDYDRCHLGIAAEGWAPIVARDVTPGTPEAPLVKDFVLEPAYWLEGRVVDEEGRPLEGVAVRVMPEEGLLNEGMAYPAVVRETETDGEGRFRLEELPGPTAGLRLRGDGRPVREQDLPVNREVELVLGGWGAIRGRVLDGASGEPVPVFTVRLVEWEGGIGSDRVDPGESFTAADGRFVLRHLEQEKEYGIAVLAEGYMPGKASGIRPAPESGDGEVVVSLSRGKPLAGVVLDAVTGLPIEGAQVGFSPHEKAPELLAVDWTKARSGPFELEVAQTPAGGWFEFLEGDRPGTLLVRARGHRPRVIRPEDRQRYLVGDGSLRIALEPGARLSGTLVLDGRPAPGKALRLARLTGGSDDTGAEKEELHGFTKTDGDGRFGWDDLTPGVHVLEVTRKPEAPRSELEVTFRRRVVISADAPVELEMHDGPLSLSGRLSGMEDRESLWARVVLRPEGDDSAEVSFKTYREWDWRFVCPGLRAGSHRVDVEYFTPEGDRTLELPPLDLSADAERVLAVPPAED